MKDQIREQLKTVIDPELGINIVDLGLVYGIEVNEEGEVDLQLTLTTPMCPLAPIIEKEATAAVIKVPGVHEVTVELVWEPSWTKEMMSQEARLQLGMAGSTNS